MTTVVDDDDYVDLCFSAFTIDRKSISYVKKTAAAVSKGSPCPNLENIWRSRLVKQKRK